MRVYEYEIKNSTGEKAIKRILANSKSEAMAFCDRSTFFINGEIWKAIKSSFRRIG